MTMRSNMSIKRLGGVLATAIAVAGYPAFAMAFQNPLPDGAGIEEILLRLKFALIHGLNAIIPSIVSALVGFFTRANRHLPLNAVADIEAIR